jgi:WD40 repeat protein
MAKKFFYGTKSGLSRTNTGAFFFTITLALFAANKAVCRPEVNLQKVPSSPAELKLKEIPFRIVYETYRKTNGKENWELYLINSDGSNPVNLTNTPDIDELYPHTSPDGSKICFVADEGTGKNRVRNVYYINIDGTGRVKVADNARQSCWSPDGKTIAYLKGEFERYNMKDYATKGISFYDLETRKHREHQNKSLHHLYNICWSPDGNWFLATVHGGMGFKHANLAIEANGTKVFDLTKYKVTGCRPDCSLDGKKVTWGLTDWDLCIGEIDLTSPVPRVSNVHRVVKCGKEHEVYHTDFSPDGKYITFSYGPKASEQVGGKAPGWNICISDMTGKWVQITTDGNHNKEPDWVPIGAGGK